MIALLVASVASAGNVWTPCERYAPIGGTAGFDNALAAVRTNAQTYGAGAFARDRLKWRNVAVIDFHIVAGAAQVPTLCDDIEGRNAQSIYRQPLDVAATNLGLALPLLKDGPLNSRFRFFYASSVTQSAIGVRAGSWSLPLMNLYPAAFAPVVGRSSTGRSIQAYAVDWIGGAYFGSDVVSVQAGYTGTRGLYLDVTQEKLALFANTVLSDGVRFDNASYLLAGLQQLDLLELGASEGGIASKVGVMSLFYRDLPQGEAAAEEVPAQQDRPGVIDRLKTGHLRQEDMLDRFDFRAAWQLGGQSRLRELAVAIHSEDWHERRGRKLPDSEAIFYVRAGLVNLPDQPTFGVQGGVRPTLRADVAYKQDGAVLGVRASARMNDPDLLDLYPFAYNALGINVELTSQVGD